MFNRAYIRHLKEEISYLRSLVKEKDDQLLKVTEAQRRIESYEPVTEPIRVLNEVTGMIEKMDAETEEEIKQREDALQEMYEIEQMGA